MSKMSDLQATFDECLTGWKGYCGQIRDEKGHKRYRFRTGDAYRDERVFGRYGTKQGYGAAKSNHKVRLAVDVILDYWDGRKWVYDSTGEHWKEIGPIWAKMHPLAEWGGSGRRGDPNHLSFQYQGRW